MKRTISLILLVLFFCIQFTSCNKSQEKTDSVDVYTLKGPSAISMVQMIDETHTLKGKEVHFKIKNEPLQIRSLIFQKKADFAIVPTNLAAIIHNKKPGYQLAAVPVWGTLYLFGSHSEISNWEDLKNKRIHLMAKGMTPDVMFR